jgi:predicted RNA-binding Zn ribbon-like protein
MNSSFGNPIEWTVVARPFAASDLVGGHPALDLVNTVTARNTAVPVDWLDSFERLVEWASLASTLDKKELKLLINHAAAASLGANRALGRIKRFREVLHTAYSALLAGERVPQASLDQLGATWQEAQSRTRLEHSAGAVAACLTFDRSGLDLIRDTLAAGAIELLRNLPANRARVCAGDRCGWLFIDSSKGGQRVWCDMATCGNAAKTRRHQNQNRRARAARRNG